MNKRVFLVVLDSFGIGHAPDAEEFGDKGANTLSSCFSSPYFAMPNMQQLGLFNIDGVSVGDKVPNPTARYARLIEKSKGKDTIIGHWEIAGKVSSKPMPVYPNGFPEDLLDEFSKLTGRGVLCNKPYSGTDVIRDYGDEHVATGKLIVYTSADSVFQIAAHEDVVPLEELYHYCHQARELLTGEHGVGRVIARPFIGETGSYTRTSNRHDYALEPTGETVLDRLLEAGRTVIAVGKINDIFAGRGISEYVYTRDNADGIEKLLGYMDKEFDGLCFVNLVDFDMLYGHRRDADGYAKALNYFDSKLPKIIDLLGPEDCLIITADHGCDPCYTKTTDHTRECVPVLIYGESVEPKNLGTITGFDYIADFLEKFVR